MQETNIQDYAQQLFDAHCDKAIVEAAQSARFFEEQGNTEDAATWRQIETALQMMRGPNQS